MQPSNKQASHENCWNKRKRKSLKRNNSNYTSGEDSNLENVLHLPRRSIVVSDMVEVEYVP
jgi:hypothetical protein